MTSFAQRYKDKFERSISIAMDVDRYTGSKEEQKEIYDALLKGKITLDEFHHWCESIKAVAHDEGVDAGMECCSD